MSMTPLGSAIVHAFLAGEMPELAVLGNHAAAASVRVREFTGVGLFTHFDVPSEVPRVPSEDRFALTDVGADIEGAEFGAGFVLFVQEGVLDCLEGFTYTGEWPTDAQLLRWYYLRPEAPESPRLVESPERDVKFGLSRLPGHTG